MSDETAVAIVGMACRYPGAAAVGEFWANLRGGVDGITRFDRAELVAAGMDPDVVRDPDYVPARGLLPGADRFDRQFFGYSPAEAATIDPQQRVFLECAAQAMDDAAVDPVRFPGWIGVFGGCDQVVLRIDDEAEAAAAVIGQDKDFLASRVAYKLGLRGPAVVVQTACSTSLAAVHTACQSLLGYECDAALAGGVSVLLPQTRGYRYTEGGILSRDGRCRPFDADSGGTVASAGVGVVVLKRLPDAIANGDRIVAVIAGSAINNDGGEKIGYTAPSVRGQRDVIRLALEQAGVAARDVGYVEAHGTGTQVGDPVEVAALTAAFRESTADTGFCWLGAVKANIGHTGSAAGVAGLIKASLMLQHRELVPTPHYRRPNPRLELAASPFQISATRQRWAAERPLVAGVSSFGIGGTNVHAVLAEAPDRDRPAPRPAVRVFPLSAASEGALEEARQSLAERLAGPDRPRLDDAALTLAAGRRRFPHRLAVVGADPERVAAALRAPRRSVSARPAPRVGFLFPGQGTLQAGAGRAAHAVLPAFREAFDEISAQVRRRFGIDVGPVVTADAPAGWAVDTVHQQLGLFTLGYALARQFDAWGIVPVAMLGNSIGEYVAATVAGGWAVPDALTVIHERAVAMRAAPAGRMVSVAAPAAAAQAALRTAAATAAIRAAAATAAVQTAGGDGDVVVAIAGPGQSVLSGPAGAIEALLTGGHLSTLDPRPLDTALAFHSPLMRAAAEAVRAAAVRVPPGTAGTVGPVGMAGEAGADAVRVVSNLTGDWTEAGQLRDPDYWAEQLIRPVRLDDGIGTLLQDPCDVYVELGPGASMSGSLRRHRLWTADRLTVPLLPRDTGGDAAEEGLARALGTLWEQGLDLPLEDLLGADRARRCALPAHPLAPTPMPAPRRPARRVRADPAGGAGRTGLTRPAWVQTEPAAGRRYDALLPLGAPAGPGAEALLAALAGRADEAAPAGGADEAAPAGGADEGAPAGGADEAARRAVPWNRSPMLAAVAEFGRSATPDPAVVAFVPAPIDAGVVADLDAVVAAAGRAGTAVVLACRGVFDVLGEDDRTAGAGLLAAWLEVTAARSGPGPVVVLDLGTSGAPVGLPRPAGDAGWYAWRGRRWWARTEEPVPPAAIDRSGPVGDGARGRSTVAVVTWGLPDGRRVAADLAAAGLRIGGYAAGEGPPAPYPLAGQVPAALARTLTRPATEAATEAVPLSARPDLRGRLDTFCAGLIGRFALDFGRILPGARFRPEELRARLDPTGLLPRFADYLISVLVAEGWLERTGERLVADAGLPERVAGALAAGAGLDDLAGLRRLLEHCAAAYPAVFAGERDRVSVLNPDGDPTMMREGLIDNRVNPSGDVARCIETVCRAVRAAHGPAAATRDGAPLRILEVGAGQGELTWPLLSGWADRAGVSYHFTDISPLMVRKAQARAAEDGHGDLRFSIFDLTADPVDQGLAAATYDLILAYNAIHVAPDVRAALGRLGTLLAPGGSMCFIETTGVARWAHVLWGLTPGWWEFGADRAEAIHLDVPTWTRLLAETGLTGVAAVRPGDDADHTILLASAPPAQTLPDGIAAVGAELRRQAAAVPCDEVLYLPAGDDPAPFHGWAGLLGRPGIAGLGRASVVSADGDSLESALRRRILDPVTDAGAPRWHHLRVPRLGEAEIAALAGVLSRTDLPATARLAAPERPSPTPDRQPGTAAGPEPAAGNPGADKPAGEPAGEPAAPPAAGRAPALRHALAELWCEVLGVSGVTEADDFFALGGESLMAVHFMGRIRKRTGIDVPPAAFTRTPTFGGLVELAGRSGAAGRPAARERPETGRDTPPELVTFCDSGSRTPLFLAAPAIGTTLSYRTFAERLDDDRPVYGIEAAVPPDTPARERIRLVAEHHVRVLRRFRPEGPYLLGGWSFGAVVAHEMARRLAALGAEVEAVVCLDGYVPSTAGRRMSTIPGYLSTGLWYQLQAQLRIGAVGDLVRVAPDVRRVFNASIRAIWHYRPVPVPCAAVVLKTGLGPARARWLRDALSPMYRSGVEVRVVPGNHWTVLDERHADRLAEEVRRALRRMSPDRAAALR